MGVIVGIQEGIPVGIHDGVSVGFSDDAYSVGRKLDIPDGDCVGRREEIHIN